MTHCFLEAVNTLSLQAKCAAFYKSLPNSVVCARCGTGHQPSMQVPTDDMYDTTAGSRCNTSTWGDTESGMIRLDSGYGSCYDEDVFRFGAPKEDPWLSDDPRLPQWVHDVLADKKPNTVCDQCINAMLKAKTLTAFRWSDGMPGTTRQRKVMLTFRY